MLTYIIRRLMLLVPTLLGVCAVVFFVMAFAPGGFGGAGVSVEGSQTTGQDAKRIRQQLERRYGLDLPKVVQFGRWLNQVSPVGFRMSSDVRFSDEERAAVVAVLEDEPFNTRPARLDTAVSFTETVAGYAGLAAEDAAELVETILHNPSGATLLLKRLDIEVGRSLQAEVSELHERWNIGHDQRQSEATPPAERAAVQNDLLRVLAFEASGRSRVRFDRPAVKWPDLGESLRGRRVVDLLIEVVPVTILLNVLSLPLIYAVSITSGLYAARNRGGAFDVASGATFIGLWSIPTIWAGVMLITYLANEQYLRWFPAAGLHDLQAERMPFFPRLAPGSEGGFERGWLLDWVWHLVLPVACMTYGGFAVMSKVMRGAMLDNLSADFVRTARAKGLSERVVLWRHAFRNSLLPMITMVSGILPALFAGAVVVETIFSINGMGKLGVDAAFQKDREVVMAVTLLSGLLGLFSELVRDVCYALADPRVAYD